MYPFKVYSGSGATGYTGITRRDWLAGLAMQGMMAEDDVSGINGWGKAIPVNAYYIADAMIAEGNK